MPLGTLVRAHVRALIDDVLRNRAQAFKARGLIDLSDDARANLLNAAGNPKSNLDQDEIREALFGPGFDEGSPHRHRRDVSVCGLSLAQPAV